ncbi:Pectate trisaccharide-lyase [Diplonema papillatum]|nr:Pectate trisaccharide-lyase [Diplonema papillatum]
MVVYTVVCSYHILHIAGFASENGGTTGGFGGRVVEVSTGTELLSAICGRASNDEPLVVIVGGTITLGNTDIDEAKKAGTSCKLNGYQISLVKVSNITLMGMNGNALFDEIGIGIQEATNIVLQGLHVRNVKKEPGYPESNGGNAVGMARGVRNLWMDHCTLEAFGGETNGYDGLMDMTDGVQYVTVSYCACLNSGRGGLVGKSNSDNTNGFITFHHNYYWFVAERTPALRFGTAHLYNNFWVGITHSGINPRRGGKAKVENNYFLDSYNPVGTFWDSQIGYWDVAGNVFENVTWVAWRDSDVPAGPNPESTANITIPYSYDLDAGSCTGEVVLATAGAGRGFRVSDGACGVEGNPTSSVPSLPDPSAVATPIPYSSDPNARKADGHAAGATGGDGGTVVIVESGTAVLEAICHRASPSAPITIFFEGTATMSSTDFEGVSGPGCTLLPNEVSLVGVSNITMIGYNGGAFDGIGLHLENTYNIIIQRFTMKKVFNTGGEGSSNAGSAIRLTGRNDLIWIDHISFDGRTDEESYVTSLMSIGGESSRVTVSYSVFKRSASASSCSVVVTGASTKVTLHHNELNDVDDTVVGCMVGLESGETHLFNNRFYNSELVGVNVQAPAAALLEKNVFEKMVNPFGAVFGSLGAGTWVISKNLLSEVSWTIPPNTESTGSVFVPYMDEMDVAPCLKDGLSRWAGTGTRSSDFDCLYTLEPLLEHIAGFASENGGTTGGFGGRVVEVSTGTELLSAICGRASNDEPLVVIVGGTITLGNTDIDEAKKAGTSCKLNGYQISLVKVSNITLMGMNGNALFDEIGIGIQEATNIVLQGLHVRNVKKEPGYPESNGGNAVGMARGVRNLWMDHCTLEAFGGETNGYDGLMDMTDGVQYVTVSYCACLNSGRGGLVGKSNSDNTNGFITFHHNYYWFVAERTPALRFGTAHLYNNFWVGITHSGINPRRGGKAKVENNYFLDSYNPVGTFWDSQIGYWDVAGNVFENVTWVAWRDSDVPAGPNPESTANITIPYSYDLDAGSCTGEVVLATAGAGRGFRVSDGACGVEGNPTSSVPSLPDPSAVATPIPYSSDPNARKADGHAAGATGGDGGTVVIVESGTAVLEAICHRASPSAPITIFFEGTATMSSTDFEGVSGPGCTLLPNEVSLVGVSNITMIGYNGGAFDGIGLHLENTYNIIIQRFTMKKVFNTGGEGSSNAGSAIRLTGRNDLIWIDHISFDGRTDEESYVTSLMSIGGESSRVTVSYSVFKRSASASSCSVVVTGASTKVTLHHNELNDVDDTVVGCMVGLESGETHLFNNRFYNSELVGVNVQAPAAALLEKNVFEKMVNPFGAVFGSLGAGTWVISKNLLSEVSWTIPPNTESTGSVFVPYMDEMDVAPCLKDGLSRWAGTGTRSSDFDCLYTLEPLLEHIAGFASENGGTTGGFGGRVVEVSTGTELLSAICGRASNDEPLVVIVGGTITLGNTDIDEAKKAGTSCKLNGYQISLVKVSNITLMGMNGNALFDEIGIGIQEATNIVLQGLHVRNVKKEPGYPESNGGNAVGMARGVRNLWMDHCTLEAFGGETNGYDGLMDMTDGVQYVTVSYCACLNSGRGGLVGKSNSDNTNGFITFHHNYYWFVAERTPALRFGTAHLYNNFWVGITHSGINPRRGGKAKVENNYFLDSYNPVGTFWDSQIGYWDVAGNVFENVTWVAWRDSDVPAGPNPESTANITIPYSYDLDAGSCTGEVVLATAGAGRGFRVSDGACGVEGNPTSSVPSLPDPSAVATPIPYSSDPNARKADGHAAGATGGDGGTVVIVESGTAVLEAICHRASPSAPITIFFEGTATMSSTDFEGVSGPGCTLLPNEVSLVGVSNITMIGYNGGAFDGIGLHLENTYNIIIQRFTMKKVFNTGGEGSSNAGSAIRLTGRNDLIWIDHISFDGRTDEESYVTSLMSIGGESSRVTVSYSVFKRSASASSCSVVVTGASTKVTLHHNELNDVDDTVVGCMVGLESGETHLFNNRFYNSELVGVNVQAPAAALLEKNVFEKMVNPFGAVFGSLGAGTWVISKNLLSEVSWTIPPNTESTGSVFVPYMDEMDVAPCLKDGLSRWAGTGTRSSDFDCLYTLEPLLEHIAGFASENGGTTGGFGGRVVEVSTGTELLSAICGRASNDEPLVVIVGGTITLGNTDIDEAKKAGTSCKLNGYQISLVKVSNITLMGMNGNALFDEIGIGIQEATNIVLQGLHVRNVKKEPGYPESNGGNAVGMARGVRNLWMDHCTLEAFGGETNGYDGLMDMTDGVQYVTVSYCACLNSGRGGLVGKSNSDNTNGFITFHHNYYWFVAERTPALRFGTAHLYNNFWVGITHSGINPRRGGKAKVENNYFLDSYNPVGTFWDSQIGYWDVAGNVFENVTWVAWRDSDVPAGPNPESTANITIPYSYDLDAGSCTGEVVLATAGAGRGFRVSDGACGVEGNPTSSVPSLPDPSAVATPIPYSSDPNARKADGHAAGATGGDGGTVVIVESGTAVLEAICHRASPSAPITIFFEGTATMSSTDFEGVSGPGCTLLPNEVSLVGVSNITMIGYNGGAFDGIGLHLENTYNIIIQRFTMKKVFNTGGEGSSNAGSAIRLTGRNDLIWIDHISFDGRTDEESYVTSLMSIGGESSRVTVSYSVFKRSASASSCSVVVTGASTKVTLHHNELNDVDDTVVGCMVGLESGETHLFNNRFYNSELVGVNVQAPAAALLEKNVFEKMVNPFGAVFGSLGAGTWVISKNLLSEVSWTIPPNTESTGSVFVPYMDEMDVAPCLKDGLSRWAGTGTRSSEFDCLYTLEPLLESM